MSVVLNPYLNFTGKAREAMEFYQSVLGGELTVSTFGENGGMGVEESELDQVMHSQITTETGLNLMASDVPSGRGVPGPNSAISLSGDDADTLRGYWDGLSAGANVTVPLDKSPWGDWFGMLTDKYQVDWMVNISGAGESAAE
jgi:PhnB protein